MFNSLAARIYELPGAATRCAPMEGLRAYAALLVFLVHYFDAYGRNVLGTDLNGVRLGTAEDPATGIAYYLFASHYGVDLFFFLSGFLIYRVVTHSRFSYGSFVRNRLLRIYPAFAVALAIWGYLRIEIDHWYTFDIGQLLGNLLFLNAVPALDVKPYAIVTWSLFYEFVFYLSFPAVLLLAGRGGQIGPLQVLLFGAAFMAAAQLLGGFYIRFLMFFGGALLASLPEAGLRRVARRIPDALVIAVFMGSTLFFADQLSYGYFIPVFAATSFLLVLQALHGNGFIGRALSYTPLRYLGNVSYSFYLIHGLGIDLVMKYHYATLAALLPSGLLLAVTFTAALAIGVGLATLLFVLAERPYFHRRRRAAALAAPRAAAA